LLSIVCVFNNEKILKNVLLKSLKNQTIDFDLITLDNRGGRFKSAAEALNYGGTKAKGDYIIFAHQDMWFPYDEWLEDVQKIIGGITDLGIAGVAGVTENVPSPSERLRYSPLFDVYDKRLYKDLSAVSEPEKVQTLDECLLIVPRNVFAQLKFDEELFDGWDCYAADYCLAVQQFDLAAYVIPTPSIHCAIRAKNDISDYKDLLKYQKILYKKYKNKHKKLYTWMGNLNEISLAWLTLRYLYKPVHSKLFPDLSVILKKNLSGCNSILDLGCGNFSPIYACNTPFSVGVDVSGSSLQESRKLNIHNEYIRADVTKMEFKSQSVDAVIALNVLGDLTKYEGEELLRKMGQWARKKIVVTMPNKDIKPGSYDNNLSKEQGSAWSIKKFSDFGFKVRGISGWKGWKETSKNDDLKLYLFWRGRLSNLTRIIVYFFPKIAHELLITKNNKLQPRNKSDI